MPSSIGIFPAGMVGMYLLVLLLLLVTSAFPMVGIAARLVLDVAESQKRD